MVLAAADDVSAFRNDAGSHMLRWAPPLLQCSFSSKRSNRLIMWSSLNRAISQKEGRRESDLNQICRSSKHHPFSFFFFLADVNSWLVTFGFQLYNVIPGYRKPNTEAMEPSYELVTTQIKTQEWDSTRVRPAQSTVSPWPLSSLPPTSSAPLASLPARQTPSGARTRPQSGPLSPSAMEQGSVLNRSCNCRTIREIHSPFPLPPPIDFVSTRHRQPQPERE